MAASRLTNRQLYGEDGSRALGLNPHEMAASFSPRTQSVCTQLLTFINGYDYARQAWVKNGRYQRCGHPDTMVCGCYGREHMGEPVTIEALPDIH